MPVIDIATDTENLTMTVTAEFAAPIERVWHAYSDPRQLERFWGPPSWPATFLTWDHTVGGRADYAMTGPHGERHRAYWEFLEIEEPHRFSVLDGVALSGRMLARNAAAYGRLIICFTGIGVKSGSPR